MQWQCLSLRAPVCMRHQDIWRSLSCWKEPQKIFGICDTPDLVCKRSHKMNYLYLHQCVTLTVPLARLLLCQFLLRCDFRRCQAPAGIQLLWFVADDGTVLTRQLAASNHSNRKGGELSEGWARSQVMSLLALTTSPSSPPLSSPSPVNIVYYYCTFMYVCWY